MFKKTVSFTTLWSFIGMTVTGIVLFIIPEGRVAYWVDLKIIGLSKDQWGDLHTTLSALFMISGVLHIILNWNSIVYYMKNKAKKNSGCYTSFYNIFTYIYCFCIWYLL